MVTYLTIAVPVLSIGCLGEMIYDCPAILLTLKPLGIATVILGTTTMRKMGQRLNEHSRTVHVRVTPIQMLLCAAALVVATLMCKYPELVIVQLLELAVVALTTINLWYHFIAYRQHVNRTFESHRVNLRPMSTRNIQGAADKAAEQGNNAAVTRRDTLEVNKKLSVAKQKLQANMTLGVLVSLNLMLLVLALFSPIWERQRDTNHLSIGKCLLRGDEDSPISNVDWARFTVMTTGFLAGHIAWYVFSIVLSPQKTLSTTEFTLSPFCAHTKRWHTFLIFKASNRRRAKVALSSKTSGSRPKPAAGQVAFERSSIQDSPASPPFRSSVQDGGDSEEVSTAPSAASS